MMPLRRAKGELPRISIPRTRVNKKRSIGFISRAYLAQRSCPSQDRLSSLLERSPDRPMAVITAPNIKAAAVPQITPIKAPRAISPLHHSTPKLTSTATTKNTTVDNITVPASLVRIIHPSSAYAPAMSPTHIAAERSLRKPLCGDVARLLLLLLGEGLAQLVLLLLWQVGGDDLEVVGLELVYHPVGGGGPAGRRSRADRIFLAAQGALCETRLKQGS
jgi:hypothetical protein